MHLSKRALLLILASTLAVALPLLGLLPPHSLLGSDWISCRWMIGYIGFYLKTHHALPAVFYPQDAIGMPFPIFYAFVLFPVLGLFSAGIDPGFIMKGAILFVWSAQFVLCQMLLRKVGCRLWHAVGVSCLWIWALYPLSNLYVRMAMAELYATGFLASALFSWLLFVLENHTTKRIGYLLLFFWFLILTVGSHPLTAIYGTPVIAVVILASLPKLLPEISKRGSRQIFPLAIFLGLVALMIASPWIAACRHFNYYLSRNIGGVYFFWKEDIDSLWCRLSFLPYGWLTGLSGERRGIDASVNMPLLTILVTNLALWVRTRTLSPRKSPFGRALIPLLGATLVLLTMSTWMALNYDTRHWLYHYETLAQFIYRFVSYQNLAIGLGAVVTFSMLDFSQMKGRQNSVFGVILAACLGIALFNVVIKDNEGIRNHEDASSLAANQANEEYFSKVPPAFGSFRDFTDDQTIPKLSPAETQAGVHADIPVEQGSQFGQVGSLPLTLSHSGWVISNVLAFPWNTVIVDGKNVDPANYKRSGQFLAVPMEKGPHVLSEKFEPLGFWSLLRIGSLILLTGFTLSVALFWATFRSAGARLEP